MIETEIGGTQAFGQGFAFWPCANVWATGRPLARSLANPGPLKTNGFISAAIEAVISVGNWPVVGSGPLQHRTRASGRTP